MHALIIEDELLIAWDIGLALEEMGYTSVAIASTERAAVEAVCHQQPDLVTADYSLAEGNGVGAVNTICRDRDVPVIFITSQASEVLKVLPDAIVISKPFSETELSEGISAARSATQH